MYLSCYDLDIKFYEVRRALQNSYEMHRTIMSAFRDEVSPSPRKDIGILHRLMISQKTSRLYVTSHELPVYDMPRGFKAIHGSPKDISAISNNFKEGMTLCFNIMAIPSKKVKVEGSKNSKRIFLTNAEEREAWFVSRAAHSGFDVLFLTEEGNIDNKLKKDGEGFTSTVFTGGLKIVNKDKFKYAYQNGIGAGKSFGCGMLLISRL